MLELIGLFANNILPVFLIAGAGYVLGKFTRMDPRPISQVVFYIFSPCLLFTLLTTNRLSGGEISRVMAFATATTLLLGLLTLLIGLAMRMPRPTLAGVLLGSMFMNAGNFGLPVVLFAFGETALSYAGLYFVTVSILTYSLGAVIASMGKESLAKSLVKLFRVPVIYGVILALVFLITGQQVPTLLARTTAVLGNASIPGMLILLGLQLRTIVWTKNPAPITLASGMRLLAGPLLALALAPLFGLTGPARQALVLESAMPAAVSNILLATEFNADPPFVSALVLATTLLTPLTLTLLLAYLGA